MEAGSKLLIGIVCVSFIVGLVVGSWSTARYIRGNSTEMADTSYVSKTIDLPVQDASVEEHHTESHVSIPAVSIVGAEDTSAILVHKDSVIYRGVEQVSGISYVATVTGSRPQLEGLRLTVPERQITKTIVKPLSGWAYGVFGDGLYAGRLDLKAGFYAAYTSGPFSFHIDAGAYWSGIGPSRSVSPYIGCGVRIELFRKK